MDVRAGSLASSPLASPDGRRDVVVGGIGQTVPVTQDPRSIPEMVLEAVSLALADAAIGHDDVDAIVTASVDLHDGLTASNVATTEVVGAVGKPETRIAADGLCALLHGACLIRAGAYETVLVVAHGKPSMADPGELSSWTVDPIFLQPLGVDSLVMAGLEARAVAGADERGAAGRWAGIAARRRSDAGASTTAAEILSSPVVASPLRAGMCAPVADQAVAVVLRAVNGSPAGGPRVVGIGHDLAAHSPGMRDLGRWDGLARALARALADARISGSPEIDLFEPSCAYAHQEELFMGAVLPRGVPVASPSGGLWSGAASVAAGLGRFAAAARWLREAGRPARALAHGTWGPAGQGQAVAILEVAA